MSKKSSFWLKPWAKKEKKQLDKTNHPPKTEKKKLDTNKSNIQAQSPRRKPTPNEILEAQAKIPPLVVTNDTTTSNEIPKPRSLGKPQATNHPLNPAIKQTLDLVIDILSKDKGSSSVPLRKNPISPPQTPEKEMAPPLDESVEILEPAESSEPAPQQAIISEPFDLQTPQEYTDAPEADSDSSVEVPDSPLASLPPISDTLADIRHIKIWSLDSESVDTGGKSNEELYSEAIALYQLGLAGEKEAVPQAFKLLIHLLQNDRQNLMAEAYLGCVISLMGRDAQDVSERFKLAIKGLKILDKVVSFDSDNLDIRGLRAFVCARLPEQFFHRSDTAIEDFTYLVSRYDEDDSLFPKEFYYQILYELASAYHRLDKREESELTSRKLLSLTSDPKYKELINQEGLLGSKLPRWQRQTERRSGIKNDWSKLMYDEKLQEGISLHSRAIKDDEYALDKAFEIFKQAYKRDPHDPLIKAYYADCLCLLGLNSSDTSTMFRHASHAIKLLDQAVNSRPDDITIRFIRGYNSYQIPEAFFRRTLTAIHDFSYIVRRYEEDSSLLPEETYWQILYDLGDAYDRLDMSEESQSTWLKLSHCENTPYSNAVSELLDEDLENPLTATTDLTPEELLREGIRLHEFAVTGHKKASAKAYEVLLKAHQADITNPLAQGYLGSSLAILGQGKTDPAEIYHHFFKGMKQIKQAIAKDPHNYTLHLLLAKVMYHYSPSFFQGNDKILKELKSLKLAYERDHSVFPEEEYLQILYDLGACYQRAGDSEKAQKCWEKLSKLTLDPKYSQFVNVEQKGAVDMDKDKIRDKFKEIATDIAQEKAKEKAKGRKERKHAKGINSEQPTEQTAEKKRRRHKKDETTPAVLTPTATPRKRRKDRKNGESTPATPTSERVKLSPEEKKVRREEKEKARAEALEKAMNRAKRTKKEENPED
ncbi:hypothetical protein Desdi_3042 [Desulfitobacterium dichloroeliminans LMG P-21439]|uniref:Tetratricopeptide repeat protein n=1 Tax=Desulfitobacterium dichloroeliminans (strain LMG P-21439 / DCA1) TaxID=871963 RepID=L0FB42_DESDL|nr:tetratricopeptide repeat protein [Desulfitobacterium dichloroeliminans]AGA70447.1 hypothetical protein Desdi_3042 [Desulfitobacterium dichloroeliminans LMG P-21439]